PHHLRPVTELEGLDVPASRGRVLIPQRRLGGPPGESLDRQRAAAAEQIQHSGARDLPQDREDRLANALRRRSEVTDTLGPPDPPAPQLARRDPKLGHLRSDLLAPLIPEAAPRLVHQRSERGRLQRAVALAQLENPATRFEQESGVFGQRGGPEAGQTVLAGAEDLALAPDREIVLGQGE